MNFPKITTEKTIVFPIINTLKEIVDAEEAFEEMIQSKFESDRPRGQDIHMFREYMKPWFKELYARNETDKNSLISLYGQFLRNLIINSLKSNFISREYLGDSDKFFYKIKLYLRIIPLSISQARNDAIFIKFGELMGSDFEQKVRHTLSKRVNFDKSGNAI